MRPYSVHTSRSIKDNQRVSEGRTFDAGRLRVGISWHVLGSVINAACQWGIIVLLAKLGDPSDVGRYALGLAVTMPVIILFDMRLRVVVASDTHGKYSFTDYVFLKIVMTVITILTIVCLSIKFGAAPGTAWIIFAVGTAKTLDTVSEIYYGLFLRHRRTDILACSLIMKGPLGLGLLVIVIAMSNSLFWGLLTLAAGRTGILILYDRTRTREILRDCPDGPRSDNVSGAPINLFQRYAHAAGRLPGLMWKAIPLGLAGMVIWLEIGMPRYFVQYFYGEWLLGIFAGLMAFLQAVELLGIAGAEVCLPRLASYYSSENYARFRALMGKLLVLGTGLGVAGMIASLLFGRPALSIFLGPEYAVHANILIWLMGAGIVSLWTTMTGCSMLAAQKFRLMLVGHVLATAVGFIACALLIPGHGLLGAAWALSLSYLTRLAALSSVLVVDLRNKGRKTAHTQKNRGSGGSLGQ